LRFFQPGLTEIVSHQKRLREHLPARKPAWPATVDASAAERDLLKKFVEAAEWADFRILESIIRADATFRMPPSRMRPPAAKPCSSYGPKAASAPNDLIASAAL